MPASPASTDLTAYRACLKQASVQARDLMQRCIAATGASLADRAARAPDGAQRQLVHEAIAALKKQEAALAAAYPQELLAEFAKAAVGESARGGALSFAQLELVDDQQVQESVEVLRVQQSVGSAVEAELVQLNSLVCAAQGLPTVRSDRNPLRPDAYVRGLRTVLQRSPATAPVRLRWLQYLGEAMGPELARCYAELCAFLRQQGVSEAGFQVVQQPEGARPRGGPGGAAAGEPSTLLTVHALRRLLSPDTPAPREAAPTRSPAESGFAETLPAAAEVLQEMRHVDSVMRRLREREAAVPGGGSAGLRAALKPHVHTPGQAVALEVVSLMVENVAGDARLLEPVREAVRALEPALLRLGLADPRFFSDRRHPARRLVDEMTSRSLAWTSEQEPGFDAFMSPLREAVDALASTHVTGPEPYEFALETLEDTWSRGQSRERRRREKAVRSLLHAEQRSLLAARLAQEVQGREDLDRVAPEVSAFLRGPWVQAMAQAQLAAAEGDADPGGLRAVVPLLLWSVQPHTTPVAVARLQRELPALVETLRRGLLAVGYEEGRIARFLDRLAVIHQRAVKGEPAVAAESLSVETLDRLLDLRGTEGGAWLAPQEAQETGYLEPTAGQALFQDTEQARAARQTSIPQDQPRQLDLEAGHWVEMLLEGRWSRWQVAWTSPQRKLVMFNGPGGTTKSMTPILAGLMADSGLLRVVATAPLLDSALDAVADVALRNSADDPPGWSWTRGGDR